MFATLHEESKAKLQNGTALPNSGADEDAGVMDVDERSRSHGRKITPSIRRSSKRSKGKEVDGREEKHRNIQLSAPVLTRNDCGQGIASQEDDSLLMALLSLLYRLRGSSSGVRALCRTQSLDVLLALLELPELSLRVQRLIVRCLRFVAESHARPEDTKAYERVLEKVRPYACCA